MVAKTAPRPRRAYIGLGANLGAPADQVQAALEAIGKIPSTALIAKSALYRSAPLGGADQPAYCNAVCMVETTLTPESLLKKLHAIETSLGRTRPPQRWASRLIDLDLLIYEGESSASESLTLPHPEMHKRNFVMVPLATVAPELEIPGHGRAADLAQALGQGGLSLWKD